MFNNLQRLAILAMAILLSFAIFPSSPLSIPHYSIVYAAVISCGVMTGIPCYGTPFDDVMRGDNEYNVISGMDGNDQISGAGSFDNLHGGYGNDQLNGGTGDDTFYGSVGADSFRCGPGIDRITDFNAGEGDTKSNDCENTGYGNRTGVTNETLTGFPENYTLSGFPDNATSSGGPSNDTSSANNLSSQ